MVWNWELPDWPKFVCNAEKVVRQEREFLLAEGSASAFFKTVDAIDYKRFVVEVLSSEGEESARIEGEVLDRESLQSSIRRHFGLQSDGKREGEPEARMAKVLCQAFGEYCEPLTHEMMYSWHATLFEGDTRIENRGQYRTHSEPMQIVSGRYGSLRVFFEAPPSDRVYEEMEQFVRWFNREASEEGILVRAAVAHIYFELIHPFEDGNGRIGRILAEKVLSQGVGRPIVIAVSRTLERRKKEYYAALQRCNSTLEVDPWIEFFTSVVLEAQQESIQLLHFLLAKSQLLRRLEGQLNPRQVKVLLRLFAAGPAGFQGGLSAENYITITKTSRATATRDLADLVKKRALTRTGERRHTRYYLLLERDRAVRF